MFAHGKFAGFLFALADEQDSVHFIGLGTANAGTDLVGRNVDSDPDAVLA